MTQAWRFCRLWQEASLAASDTQPEVHLADLVQVWPGGAVDPALHPLLVHGDTAGFLLLISTLVHACLWVPVQSFS